MKPRFYFWLLLYQLAAGLSDTCTGLLLVIAPTLTLHLMRVDEAPVPAVFVSYIGAFVLGVGLTYLWILLRQWRGLSSPSEWEAHWRATAVIRSCIAVFVFAQVAGAHLERSWISVAASDGALALIQLMGLHRGWLRMVQRDRID